MASYIGIDVGGTFIKGGLVSKGQLIDFQKIETEAERGPERVIQNIASLIERLKREDTEAAGVGVPGMVDMKNGIVRLPPNLPGWDEVHLTEKLEQMVSIPTFAGNDANFYAVGEWQFGAGIGADDLIVLTLGTGLGGGIISGGRLLLGANFAAGEVGHISIVPNGQQCRCGNRGCIEAYVGRDYLVERAKYLAQKWHSDRLSNKSTLSPKLIAEAADEGDEAAKALWHEFGRMLGIAIVNYVHILDPELVVLGGGVVGAWNHFIDPLMAEVKARLMDFPERKLKVVKGALGDMAGIYGAAFVAMKRGAV